MLKVHFPAFKFWKLHAILDNNCWWLANHSKIVIEFKDFKIDFKMDVKKTYEGFLKPKVYGAVIDFGDSSFYHENKFLRLFINQFIDFLLVMIENSVYFIGDILFTNLGEPLLTSVMNDYKLPLNKIYSPFPG